MSTVTNSAAFEAALRQDLPRGLEKSPRAIGRDRGQHARWLSAEEMADKAWTGRDGLLLGRRNGVVLRRDDDRHALTIAGSRAGKGVSVIIPTLLTYDGSAFVVDYKGENAARSARRRGTGTTSVQSGLGQRVYVLDPYGQSGLPSASYNPLAGLDVTSPDIVDDIALMADALITHPEHADRHWSESAQALLRALILLVLIDPRFDCRRHLITVRRLLTLTDPVIEQVQDQFAERKRDEAKAEHRAKARQSGEEMPDLDDDEIDIRELSTEAALIKLLSDQAGTKYGYICEGVAEQLMAMGEKERGSVLSTSRTQTQWLDSPRMAAVLERCDFDLADLKRTLMTVYLCLPAMRMATHSRWLRLMVLSGLGVMERVKVKPKQPVLFVLDEFPALGYMQSIEMAAGLMAGFGVKLWPIVQNVGQLKQHYPQSWETFVANSGVITAFGVTDTETLQVLSQLLGETDILTYSDSNASRSALQAGAPLDRQERRTLPLLAPHELRLVFGRTSGRVLILNVESSPAIAERLVYYRDPEFAGFFDPDPNHAAP